MFRLSRVRRALSLLAVATLLAWPVPASAQVGSMVTGTVLDTEGNPVEGATITIVATSGRGGKLEVKTNERGRFSQIGLQSGGYNVTAYKDGLGQPQTGTAQVNMSGPAEVNFTLGVTETEVLSAVLTGAFADGVDLSRAGQYDQAIAKFQEVLEITEQCSDCWYNIGVAYSQMKDYDKAEPAFKEALALDPAKSDTYTALANVYNAMGRFDEAAEMSAEAAKQLAASGGLNAASVFNQGVILWNGGKIPEAKTQFEETLRLDPNHGEAHYWLGMASLNEGKLPEAVALFEQYLELDPSGQYATQATGFVEQLKQ